MEEKYTPYLKKQFSNKAIEAQYLIGENDISFRFQNLDPLKEDTHQPVKGLIHKYENRALIKVSYRCAAHCRFCTRIRQIGSDEGDLNTEDSIPNIINYIKEHKEINDVILSGGDPLYTPKQTLHLLNELEYIDSVKTIRIGTRLPIHNPKSFQSNLIKDVFEKITAINNKKPIVILIHVEHPDELTDEVQEVFKVLKKTGAILLSQSVFLKGINNNFDVLKKMFETLYWNGVIPYYMYRCDYVQGLEHYVCDINEEIEIMSELRKNLSGIAYPTYIVDVEGKGKIPVPLNFWDKVDLNHCMDFENTKIKLL